MMLFWYSILFCLMGIYSYSQIDLNLTLSSNQTYQYFQQQLIGLGYYNRPLSTYLFIGLLIWLFSLYGYILYLSAKKKISFTAIRFVIAASVLFGVLSYPAFSHDLFNYLFDARIVTQYGQNPYQHSAQDFPSDLWVRFMHWTHRTYPYGPLWLVITLPFSFLGMGKFVLTLFLFKLMFAAFHLGNCWLIHRIMQGSIRKHLGGGRNARPPPRWTSEAIVAYALNPLIIIESLVSPHNEVIMTFFLLAALFFLQKKRTVWSLGHLLLSGGIKFITWVLLPICIFHKQITKQWGSDGFLIVTIITLLIPLSYVIWQREPYSWYLLPLLAIAAFLVQYSWVRILTTGLSLALLLRYAPFLYFGDYGEMTQLWQGRAFILGFFLIVIIQSILFPGDRAAERKPR